MDSGRSILGVGERFSVEHCTLERVNRADVGLRDTRAHDHTYAGAGDVSTRASGDLAGFDQIVNRIRREDGDVERLTSVDLPFQHADHLELDHELVAASTFELGTELVYHRSHRNGA